MENLQLARTGDTYIIDFGTYEPILRRCCTVAGITRRTADEGSLVRLPYINREECRLGQAFLHHSGDAFLDHYFPPQPTAFAITRSERDRLVELNARREVNARTAYHREVAQVRAAMAHLDLDSLPPDERESLRRVTGG